MSSFLLNPFAFGGLGDMEHIATITVGAGGAASMEFTSIPATFKHLQIRAIGRTSRSGNATDPLMIRLNSDTGSNYAHHRLSGDGASATAAGSASQSAIEGGLWSAATATASVFAAAVIDILDYANTSKNTTIRVLTGYDNNGSGVVGVRSGLWVNTAAVTTVLLYGANANFVEHSTAALYGVRG